MIKRRNKKGCTVIMEMNPIFAQGNSSAMYLSVTGIITQIMQGGRSGYGVCSQMIEVEDAQGGITNFFIHNDTYVVGFETLYQGMPVEVFYNANLPAALIYPPQYVAAVVAPQQENQSVYVGFFDRNLLAADGSLRLNLARDTEVVTKNNQTFQGNPGGHVLVVLYSQTTRSIPPQTTPEKVVVMCGL